MPAPCCFKAVESRCDASASRSSARSLRNQMRCASTSMSSTCQGDSARATRRCERSLDSQHHSHSWARRVRAALAPRRARGRGKDGASALPTDSVRAALSKQSDPARR
eukprot:scaffold5636_cov159-Ochromonas_danica.AAC.23